MEKVEATDFSYSLTVDDLKKRANSDEIRVMVNPATKKSFWTSGEMSGPVSTKFDENKEASIAVTHEGVAILCNGNTLKPKLVL